MLRRHINDQADHPVDFYRAGMEATLAHTALAAEDIVLDIGASSGEFALNAAESTGVPSRLVAIDPDAYAYRVFLKPKLTPEQDGRLRFVRGVGENLPLRDNSAKVVTGHNVLFRADSAGDMICEMKRVCEPGGLIILSTNARDHAMWRHTYEADVAKALREEGHLEEELHPPAETCYLEDMPGIIDTVGGLAVVSTLSQNSQVRIARGDVLDDFLEDIRHSANRTALSPEQYRLWRQKVDELIAPQLEARLAAIESQNHREDTSRPVSFSDTVHRGMYVLRNDKAA